MTPSNFPRYAYVILGMHRSGTSALAGMLSHFGADLPKNQMSPTEDNPKGYFESTPIKVLNDRILNSAGTTWDDWSHIPDSWFEGPRAQALKHDAHATIVEEFGNSPLFVFKDPRNSRLWPFWRDVLINMGITPIPIIVLRNPDEVASSLLRRDKLPLNLGRLIWLRHQLDAERWTRDTARVVTSYEAILTDRTKLLSDIEKVSLFALPRRSHATEAEVQDFIKPQLRRFAENLTIDTPDAPDIYHETYHLLEGLGSQASKSTYARLDMIGQTMQDLSGMIYGLAAPIRETARELRQVSAQRDGLQIAQRDLTQERDLLNELVADKVSLLEESMRVRDGLQIAQRELTRERDQLNELVADKVSLLEESMRIRDGLQIAQRDLTQTELAKMVKITVQREALLAQRTKDEVIQERHRIQREFRNSRSWKVTAPMRWLGKIWQRGG